MIKRALSNKLKKLSLKFPVVSVIGPRQSGKTTLVKSIFPDKTYVNLENIDTREFALNDPRGFLATYSKGAVIDEAQRAPTLFSYLQAFVDQKPKAGLFILTGSQNILLQENISQTLAGRTAILKLLPFSFSELQNTEYEPKSAEEYIFKGSYPRIYDKKIRPQDWYPNYIQTYIERDVRLLKNISDLNTFQKFTRLCAGRTGQVLNLLSLGNDCGITHNTAKSWISVLESTYIIFLLKPYYKNFNKRMIKMPKLYFYDTGLACSLLGIQEKRHLTTHYSYGSLFESFVLSEIIKMQLNRGIDPHSYFWKDRTGNEVDCVIENNGSLSAIEIKSSATVTDNFFNGLSYWKRAAKAKIKPYVIYNGKERQKRPSAEVINWREISSTLK